MDMAYAEHIREIALQLDKIRIRCPEDYQYIKDMVADLLHVEQKATDNNCGIQE